LRNIRYPTRKEAQVAQEKTQVLEAAKASELPRYEAPRIQVMTEREILNTFQITQSMATWWTTSCC
jgi:hypothetical protein